MLKAFDQTSDINGQQLYRLSHLYSLPTFTKKASSQEIYGDDTLDNHQYADPIHRQFPCHSAAATYISTLFFLDKKAEFEDDQIEYINSRLDDFAWLHGISKSVADLREKLAISGSVQDVVNDDDYALVLTSTESPSGKDEKHYPLRNALEVKKAAEFLKEHCDSFPLSYRQKIASKILDKANQFGAGLGDLDNFLYKQAGYGAAPSQEVATLLFNRAKLLKKAGKIEYAIEMGKLAKTVISQPESIHDSEHLNKLACLVDEVDRDSGLIRMIELPKPEDVFFNITEKTASQLRSEHFATTSGNIYKIKDMDTLKLADVRSLMGEDFADAISTGQFFISAEKVAEIAPTLPRGDATLFDKLLTSVGIKPVAKEAAHIDDSLTNEDLVLLAAQHKSINY